VTIGKSVSQKSRKNAVAAQEPAEKQEKWPSLLSVFPVMGIQARAAVVQQGLVFRRSPRTQPRASAAVNEGGTCAATKIGLLDGTSARVRAATSPARRP